MSERRRGAGFRPRPARLALAAVVAAGGLWAAGQSLAARTSDAAALGARARDLLGTGDTAAAVTLAHQALRRDPTVVAAVQTLGLAAQANGGGALAGRLFAYANRLSRRDLQTHLWAIERDVARGDVTAALREYDLALRTSPSARDLLFPVLGGAVADPAIAGALLRRLGTGPAWRGDFLSYMAGEPRIAPALAARFLAAAGPAGSRVAPDDIARLIARAVDAGDFASAWRAYRLARPGADPRQVRDPTFVALSDSPSAFDWTPAGGSGIVAQPVAQDGASRLDVDAGPGTAGTAIGQLQGLPPGRYRLVVDAGAISDGGALVWSLTCRGGDELTRVALASGPARRVAGPAFALRPGCAVQQLTLAVDASNSPQAVHGEVRRVAIVSASR